MFRLPEQTHRLCYYSVLIMDLCTELPAVIPPILGKVFPLLYDSLTASYDTEIYRRLRDWFVHHLSNFGLKWKWKDMIPLVDAPAADPKKQFFLDVLQHLTRLAYVKNVEQAIGPELVRLLPASPKPTFRFIETSDIISGLFPPFFLLGSFSDFDSAHRRADPNGCDKGAGKTERPLPLLPL